MRTVRQVQDVDLRLCRSARFRRSRARAIILICVFSVPALASTPVAAHRPSHKAKHRPAPAVIAEVPAEVAAPPEPPPPPLRPEQLPPTPPQVSWDGALLTIHAENSTLSDVLAAVRARTGATIDIPPAGGGERVVIDLGPAPVREVITSLLYGTEFDYIIQASDTNPDAIRSVVITPRGKEDDSVTIVGSTVSPGTPVRRMPGYSDSGKPAFETEYAPGKKSAKADAAADASAASASDSDSSDTQSASAASSSGNQDGQTAAAAPPDDNAPAASDAPVGSPSAAASAGLSTSESSGSQATTMPEMMQDLQRLYQQRRQIQAQQNQTAQPAAN